MAHAGSVLRQRMPADVQLRICQYTCSHQCTHMSTRLPTRRWIKLASKAAPFAAFLSGMFALLWLIIWRIETNRANPNPKLISGTRVYMVAEISVDMWIDTSKASVSFSNHAHMHKRTCMRARVHACSMRVIKRTHLLVHTPMQQHCPKSSAFGSSSRLRSLLQHR